MILDKVEEAASDTDADFVMQVANLGYDNFL